MSARVKVFPQNKELGFSDKHTENTKRRIEELQELEKPKPHRVYFIQESGSGAIKIGTSLNVDGRLRQISIDNPFETKLIGIMFGGKDVESLMHWLFWHANIRGEWYRPVPELIAFVSALPKTPLSGRMIPW